MSNIFRPEVLHARIDRMHGAILLARPVSSWVLVSSGISIALLIILYLCFGTYTKRTSAVGLLLPTKGTIRIQSPASGVISERRVSEGQHVRKGEVLFILADERRMAGENDNRRLSDVRAGSLSERRSSLLRSRENARLLGEQTQHGVRNRLVSLREALSRSDQEIALQARRIEASAGMLDRHRALAQSQFVSELALQEKEDQFAALHAQLLGMQRQQAELARDISAAEDELQQAPTRTDGRIAELDRDLAALSQEVIEVQTRDQYAVTAPMDGVITAITGQPGQSTSGQAIAILLPEDVELVAHLFTPSRAVGFVEKGQKVRLRYQAYPYQKFGQYAGTVIEVSRNPIQPSELPSAFPLLTQEGVYRIAVKLDAQRISSFGKEISLLPGMMLDADIEQDKRRLIEWMLEPVYSLSKYIS